MPPAARKRSSTRSQASRGPTVSGFDQVHRHLRGVARPAGRARGSPVRARRPRPRRASARSGSGHPDVEGDERSAAPRRPSRRRSGAGRTDPSSGGRSSKAWRRDVGQRALRPVEEARHAVLVGEPRGEGIAGRRWRRPMRSRRAVRTAPRRPPRGGGGRRRGARRSRISIAAVARAPGRLLAHEREHRSVVVGVDVQVEQVAADGVGELRAAARDPGPR